MYAPKDKPHERSVYHTYIIQAEHRDKLQTFLARKKIDTKIHYPIPIHLQPAAKNIGNQAGDFQVVERQVESILSLPIYPNITNAQVEHCCATIIDFYNKKRLE